MKLLEENAKSSGDDIDNFSLSSFLCNFNTEGNTNQ